MSRLTRITEFLSQATTGLVVVCALAMTGLVVKREFLTADPTKPRKIDGWQSLAGQGHVLGDSSAPVRVVEFSDFQCPGCAQVQGRLRQLLARYPRGVAIVYRHYPLLAIHDHALEAAEASECAAAQGRFREFHDRLFSAQGEIGVKRWTVLAAEAGLTDTARLARCIDSREFRGRVQDDMDVATRLELIGTPSFVVGDQLFAGAALGRLDGAVKAALERAGKGS